jgi:surfeit locus 1 family protein
VIRFRPALVPTLMVIPAIALMLGLGIWQLQRLEWKNAIIANVAARTHAAPITLEDALKLPPAEAEWRQVGARGHFLHAREVFLYGFRMGEPGLHVVTPFELSSGTVVLVDRGFVPNALRDPATRPAGQVAGETEVTGILRLTQPPAWFTPPPDRGRRLWFSRDIPALAQAAGVAGAAPVVIEAGPAPNPGGLPQGGQTIVNFPNDHLSYALTWFGLALALLAVYLVYHHRQGRLRLAKGS